MAVGLAGAMTRHCWQDAPRSHTGGDASRTADTADTMDMADDELDLPGADSEIYESDVKPAGPVETSDALGDSWDSYTVQINDTVVTLPCTIAELEAAGVELDREYTPEDYVVNAGEYELAWFEDAGGDCIMVSMLNPGSEPAEIKDCQVGAISADAWNLTNGSLKVIFRAGSRSDLLRRICWPRMERQMILMRMKHMAIHTSGTEKDLI